VVMSSSGTSLILDGRPVGPVAKRRLSDLDHSPEPALTYARRPTKRARLDSPAPAEGNKCELAVRGHAQMDPDTGGGHPAERRDPSVFERMGRLSGASYVNAVRVLLRAVSILSPFPQQAKVGPGDSCATDVGSQDWSQPRRTPWASGRRVWDIRDAMHALEDVSVQHVCAFEPGQRYLGEVFQVWRESSLTAKAGGVLTEGLVTDRL
jgi:hypothetical protein